MVVVLTAVAREPQNRGSLMCQCKQHDSTIPAWLVFVISFVVFSYSWPLGIVAGVIMLCVN